MYFRAFKPIVHGFRINLEIRHFGLYALYLLLYQVIMSVEIETSIHDYIGNIDLIDFQFQLFTTHKNYCVLSHLKSFHPISLHARL